MTSLRPLPSVLLAGTLAIACASPAAAQTTAPAAPSASLQTLAAGQRARLAKAIAANSELRRIVGDQPRVVFGEPVFDKIEAELYVRKLRATPPVQQVPIVLFDAKTNRAASAVVLPDGKVTRIEVIPAVLVPFTPEDAAEAVDLIRRSAAGKQIPELERFQRDSPDARAPRDAYVVQLLPVRGGDAKDPCSADRCMDAIFRTPRGYLPLRAHVDLTRRTVEIEGPPR
ncbi:MAG: hypothetical protein M3169_08320 [Candidatus Eremiobacteraeota bacterium]|nr:hypothetical protein [Candidatus Eremiobacteraeota bacterium]